MSTKVHRRSNCRLCRSEKIEKIVKLEPVPLAEKYCDGRDAALAIERFPIDLYMCLECGHVQLVDIIDADTLWDDYTYHSGQTKGIIDHFQEVASSIIGDCQPPDSSLVVDIGSNDGSLLRPFQQAGYRVMGIDPAKEVARKATESGIPTIADFMSEDIAEKIRAEQGPASVITAFNVFAHTDDLESMVKSIKRLLAPDGVFVFECQYLIDIIDKLLLGTIFHEHMSHHSLKPLTKFLAKHGLEMIDVKRVNIQKGSIIGTVQHLKGPRKKKPAVADLLALEEERALDTPEAVGVFSDKLNAIREKIDNWVKECKAKNASIAGYGAARSGPTLIAQFSLGPSIEYIFDDHPQKAGKFSPGDGIKVVSTSELYVRRPDYVFILAWIHADKIIANNKRYMEEGGKFVVCYPEFQTIDISSVQSSAGAEAKTAGRPAH